MRRINLLPWREERRQKRQRDFVVHLVLAALIAVATAFGIHSYMQAQIEYQQERNAYLEGVIKKLDQQIQAINELKKRKAQLTARMQVIEKLQSSRPIIVHLMENFVTTLPDGVQLTSATVTNDEKISIQGKADAQARVAAYLRRLNSADYIGSASLVGSGILAQGASGEASAGQYVFSIEAKITPPKEGEADKEN
ncbi:PilN domain-containing protein [Guyparkeria hydrothermalis]|uniref:PilN domain-containing protein n=1 Tax=Guyparkeria hydrothermalis TaxID=923 RepID=UPI0020200BDA|nr:PilN domain-containing protein [Guyparkeria hydrothermalis]MCL7745321.1 PilN domain-containing protein [Guyparkeria hydrothermalis]